MLLKENVDDDVIFFFASDNEYDKVKWLNKLNITSIFYHLTILINDCSQCFPSFPIGNSSGW